MGQSLCSKNPVLSCYTCRQFLPLNDSSIHERVVSQLRPVVTDFAAAARGNERSPSYVQMKATLDAARRVAENIRLDENERRHE